MDLNQKICNKCMNDMILQGAEYYQFIRNRIDNLINEKIYYFFDFSNRENGFEKMEPSILYAQIEHRGRIFKKIFMKAFEDHGPTSTLRWINYNPDSDHIKKNNHDPEKTYQMKNGEWVEIEFEKEKEIDLEVMYED